MAPNRQLRIETALASAMVHLKTDPQLTEHILAIIRNQGIPEERVGAFYEKLMHRIEDKDIIPELARTSVALGIELI